MSYRVAIIGAGKLGATHLRHWLAVPSAEVVAVLDIHRPHAETIASTAAIHPSVFTDFATMLAQATPDIVDVCTPTGTHCDYIQRAAAAARAVFVEKPLARTLAECRDIISLVERTGIPLMAGHVVRYFPAYALARQIVIDGGVGSPSAVRAARVASFPARGLGASWYADPNQSGGVVLDAMLHDFDWLRWCFGPVSRVYACGLHGRPEYIGLLDFALATLRFESGAIAHLTGSWAHTGGLTTKFEIAGDIGLVAHDSTTDAALKVSRRPVDGKAAEIQLVSPVSSTDDPYFRELADFVRALDTGAAPPVTVIDGAAAVAIGLAALESINSGKAMKPEWQ